MSALQRACGDLAACGSAEQQWSDIYRGAVSKTQPLAALEPESENTTGRGLVGLCGGSNQLERLHDIRQKRHRCRSGQ